MNQKIQIKEINHGIACRIGDFIYLNKNLKKYPKLYKALLKHEKEHTSKYSFKDILIDFKGNYLSEVKKDYYLFFLRYPKSLSHFCPIWIYDKTLVVDPIILLVWMFAFFWANILSLLILK